MALFCLFLLSVPQGGVSVLPVDVSEGVLAVRDSEGGVVPPYSLPVAQLRVMMESGGFEGGSLWDVSGGGLFLPEVVQAKVYLDIETGELLGREEVVERARVLLTAEEMTRPQSLQRTSSSSVLPVVSAEEPAKLGRAVSLPSMFFPFTEEEDRRDGGLEETDSPLPSQEEQREPLSFSTGPVDGKKKKSRKKQAKRGPFDDPCQSSVSSYRLVGEGFEATLSVDKAADLEITQVEVKNFSQEENAALQVRLNQLLEQRGKHFLKGLEEKDLLPLLSHVMSEGKHNPEDEQAGDEALHGLVGEEQGPRAQGEGMELCPSKAAEESIDRSALSSTVPYPSSLPESSSVDPSSSKKKKKKKKPEGKPEGKQRPPLFVLQEEALRLGLELQPLRRAPPGEQGEDLLNPLEIQGVPMPRLLNLAVSAFYDMKDENRFKSHFPEFSHPVQGGVSVSRSHPGALHLLDPVAAAVMMFSWAAEKMEEFGRLTWEQEELIVPFELSAGNQESVGGRAPRGVKVEGLLLNGMMMYSKWDARVLKMFVQDQMQSSTLRGVGFWVDASTPLEQVEGLMRNVEGPLIVASQEPIRESLFKGKVQVEEVKETLIKRKILDGGVSNLSPGYGEFFPLCSLTPSSSPRKSAALLVNFLNSPRLQQQGNQRSLWLFMNFATHSELHIGKKHVAGKDVLKVRTDPLSSDFLTTWS